MENKHQGASHLAIDERKDAANWLTSIVLVSLAEEENGRGAACKHLH